jgi:hypothetical protein
MAQPKSFDVDNLNSERVTTRQVTIETVTSTKSILRPEGNSPSQPPPREVSAFVEMMLFVLFIASRALHPSFIDNAKEVQIIDGKEKLVAPYAKMVPVLGECIFTAIVGQVMALYFGGLDAWRAIWNPVPFKVFSIIGLVYAWGDILEVLATSKVSGDAYQVLLQSKLLITAVMMRYFKGAKTSRLQWVILAVVMCAMSVYSTAGGKKEAPIDPKYYDMTVQDYVEMMSAKNANDSGMDAEFLLGMSFVVAKVTVSCFCAVLSDKYMKEFKEIPIYVQLVQFKFSWFMMVLVYTFCDGETWTGDGPLEGFDSKSGLVLLSFIVKSWLTMYLLAILDSVLKNIGEAASVLATFLLSIYVFNKSEFAMDTFLMVLVVTLAVVSYIESKMVVDKARKYDEALVV